jgi:hypothetical protein
LLNQPSSPLVIALSNSTLPYITTMAALDPLPPLLQAASGAIGLVATFQERHISDEQLGGRQCDSFSSRFGDHQAAACEAGAEEERYVFHVIMIDV